MAENRLRSPLGRALGLGSAKEGVEHWWAQRMTAVALVPLALWFVAALIGHVGADYAAAVAWLKSPIPATAMAKVSMRLVLLLRACSRRVAQRQFPGS